MRHPCLGATVAAVAFFVSGASVAAAAGDHPLETLNFQKTFDKPAPPGPLAYTATYRVGDAVHHVAIWRDGERRIKRRTDDAIESYAVKPAGDLEWSMTVLDLKRRIRTDVDRTNLMRIGYAENWFSQTHALAVPRGAYRLVASKAGAPGVTAVGACRWYELDQPQRSSKICWNDVSAIPLVIVDREGSVVWRVDSWSTKSIPPAVFDVVATGFVVNNANEDIQPD